jgi:CBS domain-containing protein
LKQVAGEKKALGAALEKYVEANEVIALESIIAESSPIELARYFLRLDKIDQTRLLELIGAENSAELISKIFDLEGVSIVEQIPPGHVVPIVKEMSGEEQVQLLRKLQENDAEAVILNMQSKEAKQIRELIKYPDDTAGSLMIKEFLAYPGHLKVIDVLDDLRRQGDRYSDYAIQYAYVINDQGLLTGVLRMRDLLLVPKNKNVSDIMIKDPLYVSVDTPLRDLREFFREHAFMGCPVTDEQNRLVGVVHASWVREAANKRNNQLFLKFAGIVGGEEFRTMPLLKRSSRRAFMAKYKYRSQYHCGQCHCLLSGHAGKGHRACRFPADYLRYERLFGKPGRGRQHPGVDLGIGAAPGNPARARQGIIHRGRQRYRTRHPARRNGNLVEREPLSRFGRGISAGGKYLGGRELGRVGSFDLEGYAIGPRPSFRTHPDDCYRYVRLLFCLKLCFDIAPEALRVGIAGT